MKQMNIQFHARKREIIEFVHNAINENDINAFGIVLFPEYEAEEIINFECQQVFKYNLIILCHDKIKIDSRENYANYLKQENGDLIISVGADDEIELVESSMAVIYNDNIDILWRKIINQFKKKLLRGAFVVTPKGKGGYYPKHGYTIGAKEAYERGVIIKPIAGWNHYILKNE